jgi:hypothetical protein
MTSPKDNYDLLGRVMIGVIYLATGLAILLTLLALGVDIDAGRDALVVIGVLN